MKKISQDKLVIFFNYFVATVFLLIAFYPLYFLVIASFSSVNAVIAGKVWIVPVDITLVGYELMLGLEEVWRGYANTIFYTIVGTCINLVYTVPAAYALSRHTLPGRRVINMYFLITMFFGGGLIPTYLLVNNLGLNDTRLIIVLIGAVSIYNMIICRTFFQGSIPLEIIEAARIDGCSESGTFFRVVLPLSKSLLAVMVLYFAVGHWNSYYNALVYLQDKEKHPLQLVLRKLFNSTTLGAASLDEVSQEMLDLQCLKYGIIVVSCIPVLMIYPFVQKHFVKGVMIGSVKG